ncbi:hypothetical protein [Ornithinimicrobium kibberense]|uniref:hypothetical protein n=1 Tax=Ornithinimicrobium kibberense TaxID=282060 RepID=UPI00361ACBAA
MVPEVGVAVQRWGTLLREGQGASHWSTAPAWGPNQRSSRVPVPRWSGHPAGAPGADPRGR